MSECAVEVVERRQDVLEESFIGKFTGCLLFLDGFAFEVLKICGQAAPADLLAPTAPGSVGSASGSGSEAASTTTSVSASISGGFLGGGL